MPVRDDVARLLSGDIPPPTLEERVRETFGVTEDERKLDIINNRIRDARYGRGVEGVPLYRKGDKWTRKAGVPQITTEPDGPPVGYRLMEPDGGVDFFLESPQGVDEDLAAWRTERANLVDEIAKSGQELPLGERAAAGAKLTREGMLGNIRAKYGDANVIDVGDEPGNVIVIPKEGDPFLADIKGGGSIIGDIADVTGDVGEAALSFGGQLAGSYLAGRRGGAPGAAASAGIGAASDVLANIARQGVSAGLAGEDFPGRTGKEALAERGAQLAATVTGGLLGEAAGRYVAGPLAKRAAILAKSRLGSKTAQAAGETVAASTRGTKVGDFLAQSQEAEAVISELSGRPSRMSVGQATGSGEALEREFALAGGKQESILIREQRRRLEDGATALDSMVNLVARQPDALGDEAVGRTVIDASRRYVDALESLRAKEAMPFYAQAEEAAGVNLFPAAPIKTMAGQIEAEVGRFTGVAPKIRKTVKFLGDRSNQNGMIDIDALNQERRFWSSVAGGQGTVSRELSPAANRRLAARMLSAIDESMDHATQNFESWITRTADDGPSFESGKSAQAAIDNLRRGNAIWRARSQQIEEFTSTGSGKGLVSKLLGLGADAAPENVTDALRRASGPQLRGMLKTLEGTSWGKDAAAQLRARMMLDVFERGGHTAAADPLGVGERVSRTMNPMQMSRAIESSDKLLADLFADQPSTRNKLKAIARWYDRIATGPQVRGAQAVPGWVDSKIVSEVAKKGPVEWIGQKGVALAKATAGRMAEFAQLRLSKEQLATLATTREGTDALFELARAQAQPFRTKAAQRGARAVVHILAILDREGLLEGESDE